MLVVSLVAFVIAFVGSMPLAGPVSVMVVARAGMGHFREARHVAFGAAIGEGLYAGLAFWGLATLLSRYASAVTISHAVTAIVLLAVGLYFVRWKPRETDGQERRKGSGAFFLGLTASLLNPTLLVTWSAIATAIYSRQLVKMTGLLSLPFGIATALGIAGWNVVLVALLRRYRNHFPKAAVTWVVRGMGLLLIGIALWSGVELVRKL